MLKYESSNIRSYATNKISMLHEFGIMVSNDLKSDIMSMTSKSEIDRRCRSIIEGHIDIINDRESCICKSKK